MASSKGKVVLGWSSVSIWCEVGVGGRKMGEWERRERD
jgi:hypothetical protein